MRNNNLYNINNLNNSINRDNATLITIPLKITRVGIVEYICNCGEVYKKKTYDIMYKGGAFCKTCTINNAKIKNINTILSKYGVEHVLQHPIIKERAKKTILENYGVEHPLQNKDLRERAKKTTLKRYGKEYASQTTSFRERVKQTCIKIYGVDNATKLPEVREKIKQTCLERYGVEYSSQCQEIREKMQKMAKKFKEYKMPSGNSIKVQGYEPFALDELTQTHEESDIVTDRKSIPRITYTVDNKKKYYFPDIYIKSINKIIEVKSTWTYKCKEDNIQLKANATRQAGYDYEIWIYDKKGNKTIAECDASHIAPHTLSQDTVY